MAYSVSDATTEILDEMSFLETCFEYDLLNYSAVARLIKPEIEKKIKEETSLDAVIMAVRRYAENTSKKPEEKLENCKITLRTGVSSARYQNTKETYEKTLDKQKKHGTQTKE